MRAPSPGSCCPLPRARGTQSPAPPQPQHLPPFPAPSQPGKFPAMSSNVQGQREEGWEDAGRKEVEGRAWGEPLEAAPECYLITFLMRKNEKTLRAKGWKLPISCKLFFLLYYSELFCFSELPCVGCTNPTDSRMGDDESLSKCRFFFPLFFFPFNTAEGVKSPSHAPIAGTSRAGAGRSSQPSPAGSAKLCPCPPWGCPARASPAPHTLPARGVLRALSPTRCAQV